METGRQPGPKDSSGSGPQEQRTPRCGCPVANIPWRDDFAPADASRRDFVGPPTAPGVGDPRERGPAGAHSAGIMGTRTKCLSRRAAHAALNARAPCGAASLAEPGRVGLVRPPRHLAASALRSMRGVHHNRRDARCSAATGAVRAGQDRRLHGRWWEGSHSSGRIRPGESRGRTPRIGTATGHRPPTIRASRPAVAPAATPCVARHATVIMSASRGSSR